MNFDFLLGLGIGIVATAIVIRILLAIAVRRAEATIQALEYAINELKNSTVSARVEEHDGVFYVYDAEDDTFLVQGTDLSELKRNLETRYRDKNIVVTQGDESVLARLKDTGAA